MIDHLRRKEVASTTTAPDTDQARRPEGSQSGSRQGKAHNQGEQEQQHTGSGSYSSSPLTLSSCLTPMQPDTLGTATF